MLDIIDNINPQYSNSCLVGELGNTESYEDVMSSVQCKPTKIHLKDLSKAIGASEKEQQEIQRYYTSSIIGIGENEHPPFDLFLKNETNMTADEQASFKDFNSKLVWLLEANEVCDSIGVKYIGSLLEYYCPKNDDSSYNKLGGFFKAFISELFSSKNVIAQLAKRTHCNTN